MMGLRAVRALAWAAPGVAASLAILPLTAPWPLAWPLMPLLPLVVVVVWSLYQPRLMPPWAAALAGLATDLALGLPAGINAALMAGVALALREGQPFLGETPFALDWALALPLFLAYALASWALLALSGVARDPLALLPQAMLSWLAFPAVARLLAQLHARMVGH